MKGSFNFSPIGLRSSDLILPTLLGAGVVAAFGSDNALSDSTPTLDLSFLEDTEVSAGTSQPPQFRAEPEHERLLEHGAEFGFFNEAFGFISQNMQQSFQRLVRESFSVNVPRQNQGFINWSAIPGLGVSRSVPNGYQQAITNVVNMVLERAQSDRDNSIVPFHMWLSRLEILNQLIHQIISNRRREQVRFATNSNSASFRRHAAVIEHWERTHATIRSWYDRHEKSFNSV